MSYFLFYYRNKRRQNDENFQGINLFLIVISLLVVIGLFATYRQFLVSDEKDNKTIEIVELIDFEPFEMSLEQEQDDFVGGEEETKHGYTITLSTKAIESSQDDDQMSTWDEFLNYMKQTHLIVISLSTLITFDWLLND